MMLTGMFIGFILLFAPGRDGNGAVYTTRNAEIALFSSAPMEDIEAVSRNAYGVINLASGEVRLGVSVRSFQFRKSLMQEHFNENYMESDKYPIAKFEGKINDLPAFSEDGEYRVTVTGSLEVHGISRQRTVSGMLKISNGRLGLSSVFEVRCRDHDIKIPSLVFRNIAETIQVSLKGTFSTIT